MTKSKTILTAAIILTTTLSSGCAFNQPAEVIYVTPRLPLPALPTLPALNGNELACISDPAYKKLVTRDRELRYFARSLIGIIKSTHNSNQTDK